MSTRSLLMGLGPMPHSSHQDPSSRPLLQKALALGSRVQGSGFRV